MFKVLTLLGVLATANAKIAANDDNDYFLNGMDDLSYHFEGKTTPYNRTFYNELKTCLGKYDDDKLYRSLMGAWKGISDCYKSNGTKVDYMGRTDYWGECIGEHDDRCLNTIYTEYEQGKAAHIGRDDILYYEPCNTVSNLAYLRAVNKICDYPDWSMKENSLRSLKRAYAQLSAGSVFFHGSHTLVGFLFDNDMIAIIAYIAYQAQVDFIAGNNTILTDLKATPRNQTIDQIVETISDDFTNKNFDEWGAVIAYSDYPHDYFVTFGGIAYVIGGLCFPSWIAEPILFALSNAIFDKDQNDFIQNTYYPLLKPRLAQVSFSIDTTIDVIGKLFGTCIKIVFAFLYQEKYLHVPGFNTPVGIYIGALSIPLINGIADKLTGFPQTDYNVKYSKDVYPGNKHCKNDQSHSIWHEVSANGLLDLVYACDFINKMTIKHYTG